MALLTTNFFMFKNEFAEKWLFEQLQSLGSNPQKTFPLINPYYKPQAIFIRIFCENWGYIHWMKIYHWNDSKL